MSELRTILVIDDDQKLCALIKDYLSPLGFEVTARHTGPEGLEEAVEGDYEAVILDVMLPGMDGFEVLRELRMYVMEMRMGLRFRRVRVG